ncbi:MAG TPA: MBL fold metallo-hydrolase [Verrucomicrobiae bacterium]|jgi:L-ascorbate metabolism protein UlaG (beta-lactamase superfamily)|nr:MBL fold metallo-hydrolase [Verrucomicrobiae bacterium]
MPARTARGLIAQTRRKILKPNFKPTPELWDSNAITASWLGHSTVLVNFFGVNILTDPVLMNHAGADLLLGTVGPKRLVAPALTPKQLPKIDLVLLSHAHMDHLNSATLRHFSHATRVVTAHSTADLLADTRLKAPKELAWGDKTLVKTDSGEVEVEAFEVKHWGARWRHDSYRGYNGYIVSREGRKIIFGGDTAWSDSFRSLRSKGPFDLAIMPIGAYQPWIQSHCTPEQAVQMANDAGANHFLPVHFKTFTLGREGVNEPIERLYAAIEPERIGWNDIGQTFSMS